MADDPFLVMDFDPTPSVSDGREQVDAVDQLTAAVVLAETRRILRKADEKMLISASDRQTTWCAIDMPTAAGTEKAPLVDLFSVCQSAGILKW